MCKYLKLSLVNAEVQDDEIIYKNYYNIGVAVGTEKGLVVPDDQCRSNVICRY